MKTIGLIGGTTWLSTVEYYTNINRMVNERLGGLNSAKILLYSLNFEEVNPPSDTRKWQPIIKIFSDIAIKLETAGADCIVIGANTPHLIADDIQQKIKIPIIHIADAAAREISKHGIDTAGLQGTKFTMEQAFFRERLAKHNISVLVPDDNERDFIHSSIFNELGKGIFHETMKQKYLEIINNLNKKGAQGIILGCTEIPLLIRPTDCDIPTFDTTLIHSKAAVDFALG